MSPFISAAEVRVTAMKRWAGGVKLLLLIANGISISSILCPAKWALRLFGDEIIAAKIVPTCLEICALPSGSSYNVLASHRTALIIPAIEQFQQLILRRYWVIREIIFCECQRKLKRDAWHSQGSCSARLSFFSKRNFRSLKIKVGWLINLQNYRCNAHWRA